MSTTETEIETFFREAKLAREHLVRAVEKNGKDYVYKSRDGGGDCYYVEQAEEGELVPSCLVGHLFVSMGYSLKEVRNYESRTAWMVTSALGAFKSASVRDALNLVQAEQDYGATWGEVLAVFDHYIKAETKCYERISQNV